MTVKIVTKGYLAFQVKPCTNILFVDGKLEYLNLSGEIMQIDISRVVRIEIS